MMDKDTKKQEDYKNEIEMDIRYSNDDIKLMMDCNFKKNNDKKEQ